MPTYNALMRNHGFKPDVEHKGSFPSGGCGSTINIGLVTIIAKSFPITRVLFFDDYGNLVYPHESGAYETYVDPYIEQVKVEPVELPSTANLDDGLPF